jgi:hypothetical protein
VIVELENMKLSKGVFLVEHKRAAGEHGEFFM